MTPYSLNDVTFITALKIETPDRLANVVSVFGFLNHHFQTNVAIYCIGNSKFLNIFDRFENLNVVKIIDQNASIFHRTLFLNILLKNHVTTPFVANYDADVIFRPELYLQSREMLRNGYDVVYPYPISNDKQIQVHESLDRQNFNSTFDIDALPNEHISRFGTFCGHAFFAKTKSYKRVGGENINFVSYGPEDRERYHRFNKLGLKVGRIHDGEVIHFEHARTEDSDGRNPFMAQNKNEFDLIKRLSAEDIKHRIPEIE